MPQRDAARMGNGSLLGVLIPYVSPFWPRSLSANRIFATQCLTASVRRLLIGLGTENQLTIQFSFELMIFKSCRRAQKKSGPAGFLALRETLSKKPRSRLVLVGRR